MHECENLLEKHLKLKGQVTHAVILATWRLRLGGSRFEARLDK
jgi:hypothetical protein